MQTAVRQDVRDEMQRVLYDFIPVLRSWINDDEHEEGRMIDPYETHYSENYSTANAAVICAGVYRSTLDPDHLELCLSMVRRSIKLLGQKEAVSPFCRVFLFHYSLMALLILPDRERKECAPEFAPFYAHYEDDCRQLNTNCAALQWGMELFLETIGYRTADQGKLDALLLIVENAQADSGFVNDEYTYKEELDGMPIAYHAFTLFILSATAAVSGIASLDSDRVGSIVGKGLQWLQHTITNDGSFAMIERSRYQMFTWGAIVALLSGTNLRDDPLFRQIWRYWLSFKHGDGSYSCVPNHLPHALRTGFESYTHVNMYNNLGLTGIAVAVLLLEERGKTPIPLPNLNVPGDDRFLDQSVGYVFFRRGGLFFGCTLRMHNRKYAPALQGFHFRQEGVKLPLAEPNIIGKLPYAKYLLTDSVWEGFLLEDPAGEPYFSNSTENARCEFLDDGVRLELDTDTYHCCKEIRVRADGFCWWYRLSLKRPFVSLRHVLPLLMHDGKQEAHVIERSPERLDIRFGGREFSLTCNASEKIGTLLTRSLLSVSGVAAPVHAMLRGPLTPGETIEWETRLRML